MRKLREKLDEMPPEQRAMVEQMLERQVPQARQQVEMMASEGPMKIEVRVLEMRVDQGPTQEMLRALPARP